MADEPLNRTEAALLRQSINDLATEMRTFRTESATIFVRQDVHRGDLDRVNLAHDKDIAFLTQAITTLTTTVNKGFADLGGEQGRVTKLENDGDWLRKIIYGAIILVVLASVGLGTAASSGAFSK